VHCRGEAGGGAACLEITDLLIVARLAAAGAYFWLGDLIKVREHADRVLALYSEERHVHLVDILNNDPKTFCLLFSA
jgi:hypothetical protein